MGLYLYAITNPRSLDQIDLLGMNQAPVQVKQIHPFTIFYSDAQQERYLASRANLLTHERIIEAVMQLDPHDVPLPLQFGLVVDGWDEVENTLIRGHQAQLQGLLDQLRGKREVGIKLFWDQMLELNLALSENPALQSRRESLLGKNLSMDEAIAIGKELEDALENRRQSIINNFMTVLQPLSSAYVIGELLTENMFYNAAYLIDWEQEPQFAEAVEALDASYNQRLKIRYNNFTAPFNFVNWELRTG